MLHIEVGELIKPSPLCVSIRLPRDIEMVMNGDNFNGKMPMNCNKQVGILPMNCDKKKSFRIITNRLTLQTDIVYGQTSYTGIIAAMGCLSIQNTDILDVWKGHLAEQLVGQELLTRFRISGNPKSSDGKN